ncbi:hypothetical protein ACH79_25745 [Bradyrhizobium sp. CCBAU 051011]|uniref:isochorismatase family protein n=1 Tax=Bradyrhizobium sp. CCBAU 051011 TaxID=858422 RepID=UPI001373B17C|nr:hypothetical protein ACH79_25745 [Bradyrhizobium sp. CCBAU 051011]
MLFQHKVNMEISGDRTALVLVDIQNDFLTDGGKYFVMIEELMKKNNVNANLEALLRAAKDHGYPVFMSPHYFFPHDHKGKTRLSPMEDLALHGGSSRARARFTPTMSPAAAPTFPTGLSNTWKTRIQRSCRAMSPTRPRTTSPICCVEGRSRPSSWPVP